MKKRREFTLEWTGEKQKNVLGERKRHDHGGPPLRRGEKELKRGVDNRKDV